VRAVIAPMRSDAGPKRGRRCGGCGPSGASTLSQLHAYRQIVIPPMLLAALLFASSTLAQARLEVEWEAGRLSVTAQRVPRSQVLEEVVHKTGLEVRDLAECQEGRVEGCQEEVSKRFSQLSLRDGLRELLGDMDYVYVEDNRSVDGVLTTLVLNFGGGASAGRPMPVRANGAGLEDRPPGEALGERLEALQAAAAQGNEGALRQALYDPDPDVQTLALELLAMRDRQGAVDLFAKAAKGPHPQLRVKALELLNVVNDQEAEQMVLSTLGEAITDEDLQVKRCAIRALAERGGPGALEYLHGALHDADPAVRMMTIDQVVRFVPPAQRLALLQEAALDKDEMVRAAATSQLE
jgi:hypothetical protein